MAAILYIAAAIYFGDCLCRRFYRFTSVQHRLATAFLVGLLFATCVNYLGALGLAWTGHPLLAGNVVFILFVLAAAKIPKRLNPFDFENAPRPPGNENWDWLCLGICLIFGWWLMVTTLDYHNGSFQFGFKSWSDFGANLSLAQSFALGDNFPSEHPFFPGEPLRYHFLFWFQSANLSFLGLNLVWAINLLSILSLLALLILMMTFTEILFGSRVAGRIAAVLFFLPSTSLAYLPFLQKQTSVGGLLTTVFHSTQFLATGYPFRGEDWGALTVAVFANQRQLISGTGILFVVLIFLIDFHRQKNAAARIETASVENAPIDGKAENLIENDAAIKDEHLTEDDKIFEDDFPVKNDALNENDDLNKNDETPLSDDVNLIEDESENSPPIADEIAPPPKVQTVAPPIREEWYFGLPTWLFSGFLIGALPYWNSAVFVAAVVLFGSLLIFLPSRRHLAVLVGMIILTGLPQILLLRSGNLAPTTYSLFHWGFIIENPTVPLVAEYLAWTFGFKWILLLVAAWLSEGWQRRLLLAFSSLLAVVFLFQLSTDAFNNHKLLNLWNVFAAVYVAYAVWRIGKDGVSGKVLAAILTTAMILTSVIDFFPVYNDPDVIVGYENDRLTTWLLENTQPKDIFLTQTLLSHPILFTGRRVFLANTLYAWTAGYNVGARETIYKRMFQEINADSLLQLLHENKIAYVAIDDGVRRNDLLKGTLNEFVYQDNFEKVFEDTGHHYDNLTIYKVTAVNASGY